MLEYKPLPESISNKMSAWRKGLTVSMPNAYIDFHWKLAEETLLALQKEGVIVHATYNVDDGWGDGMKVMQVIVELPDGSLHKLKYVDTAQSFMVAMQTGGWSAPQHELLRKYYGRTKVD